jgi:hypothetical protein
MQVDLGVHVIADCQTPPIFQPAGLYFDQVSPFLVVLSYFMVFLRCFRPEMQARTPF